jgi:hypothetical protein
MSIPYHWCANPSNTTKSKLIMLSLQVRLYNRVSGLSTEKFQLSGSFLVAIGEVQNMKATILESAECSKGDFA